MSIVDFLRTCYYWSATGLVALVGLFFYPCRAIGRENVPRKGGFILASNHESNLDPILLPIACPRQMRFMAKEELFRNPVLGWIIRTGGGFPVKRGVADRTALKEFKHQLGLGYAVMIFPQGTRGGARVQNGVGLLAVTTGMPVLPVYIKDSDKALPKGKSLPTRHPVQVVFGKPFTVPSEMSYEEASSHIMGEILKLKRI